MPERIRDELKAKKKMKKREVLELMLKTAGFTMEKFELIRDGSSMVGYEFEAHLNGKCEFQVATDSFESAISDTLEGIYSVEDVEFNPILP